MDVLIELGQQQAEAEGVTLMRLADSAEEGLTPIRLAGALPRPTSHAPVLPKPMKELPSTLHFDSA